MGTPFQVYACGFVSGIPKNRHQQTGTDGEISNQKAIDPEIHVPPIP